MKVTRDMLNEELRNLYLPMKFFSFLMTKTWFIKLMNRTQKRSNSSNIDGLHCEEFYIPSNHGDPDIRVRLYKPLNAPDELPCMLYLHGGGYIISAPEAFHMTIKKFIDKKPCVIIAPAYRKSLEAPYPAAFNDCYDTLLWINDHSDELGIIANKIIIGGHSAGGGLTAAVTSKATDTGDVKLAFQMPIYPMIDDREITESSQSNAPLWASKNSAIGWGLYLQGLKQKNKAIPSYAAPARIQDYSKLPPTITFVADLEPFRDETITYVNNIKEEDIPIAFEIFEGCFHGFETVAPHTNISQLAWQFLLDNYSHFVDKYVYESAT